MYRKTKEKWEAIFKKRENFTGTNNEFCIQNGIPVSYYYKMKKCFEEEKSRHKPNEFELVPVVIEAEICEHTKHQSEVIVVNNVQLQVNADISEELLNKLIRSCQNA